MRRPAFTAKKSKCELTPEEDALYTAKMEEYRAQLPPDRQFGKDEWTLNRLTAFVIWLHPEWNVTS